MSTVPLDQYADRLRKVADQLDDVLRPVLVKGALQMERTAKENVSGRVLKVRTGRLRASIQAKAEGLRITLQAGGSGGTGEVKYARIHEEGGVIVPKNGRYLAIPLPAARTAAGVSRFASPRDVPGLTFVQSLRGQPMLVATTRTKTGRAGKAYGVPMFLLRTSVTIPQRPYLKPAFDGETPGIVSEVSAALVKAVSLG